MPPPTPPASPISTRWSATAFSLPWIKSTLDGQAQATLDGQAQWLLSNTEYAVLIEGHADEQGHAGIQPRPRRAGARRQCGTTSSAAVFLPIVSNTISFGKERPLEICSDESC